MVPSWNRPSHPAAFQGSRRLLSSIYAIQSRNSRREKFACQLSSGKWPVGVAEVAEDIAAATDLFRGSFLHLRKPGDVILAEDELDKRALIASSAGPLASPTAE
jgi:hypothetical protein